MTITSLISDVKRTWHRELASDPSSHAWVLSLYRAGEKHPQTVLDYFPYRHAPWPELGEQLRCHRDDEARHTKMYEGAIALLGQPLEEHRGLDVFNNAIRAATPTSFAVDERAPAEVRRRQLAHFLAHAHYLESRIARSLEYHVEACALAHNPKVQAVVERVYADELRHVSYTRAAVQTLLGEREAAQVLRLHEQAEARADRAFSARQVRAFLRRFPAVGRRRNRLMYAAGALLLERGLPGV